MCPFPVSPTARQRLQAAQRAEADALKAVELATGSRDRAQRKLDVATAKLDDARIALIGVSGVSRAALLLDADETTLRRIARERRMLRNGTTAAATDDR
ncbi:hypothetical protein GCM10027053_21330 [Intrasporangium mesophilum]